MFKDLGNIYREREENKKTLYDKKEIFHDSIGEYVERDSLAVLDDVNGLDDSSMSFVNFMTPCRKLGTMYLTNINILLSIRNGRHFQPDRPQVQIGVTFVLQLH